MLLLLPLSLLLILPLSLSAENPTHTTMHSIVDQLRSQGCPVCFEEVHNNRSDAITIKERITLIQSIPPERRSPTQQGQLELALNLRNDYHHDDAIISWKQKEFDILLPDSADGPVAILKAAVIAAPEYAWEQRGTKYIVYPIQQSFNRPIPGFHSENLSLNEFMNSMVEQIAKPAGLNYLLYGTGAGMSRWQSLGNNRRFSLTMEKTDARTALTKIAEMLGPDVVWNVQGCEPDWINLGYVRVP